jgi:hypothetical protein
MLRPYPFLTPHDHVSPFILLPLSFKKLLPERRKMRKGFCGELWPPAAHFGRERRIDPAKSFSVS